MKKAEFEDEDQEERVYIVVAQTVQVDLPDGENSIVQPCGRAIAQACHAVSLMKMKRILETTVARKHKGGPGDYSELLAPTTTIVLAARNSMELEHIEAMLKLAEVDYVSFADDNEKAYGTKTWVMTAIATWPITKHEASPVLGYLPIWRHSLDV